MLDSSDIRCLVLSFRWWFMELFFVCADLLRWVPIFLHTVYSAQFCLHRCRSSPMLLYVFKMLSVDWYVRNRIKHVHPVSDGNSRCRLGAARHSTTSRVLPAQSASRVTVRDTGWTCQILYILFCISFYTVCWGPVGGVITRQYRNFNGGLSKPPLKLGGGWVITSRGFI